MYNIYTLLRLILYTPYCKLAKLISQDLCNFNTNEHYTGVSMSKGAMVMIVSVLLIARS